jgi:hypothetical protein
VIQSAFSYLDADQREFVMTGTPPHVWDEMFSLTLTSCASAPASDL